MMRSPEKLADPVEWMALLAAFANRRKALSGMIGPGYAVRPSGCSKCRDVGRRVGRTAGPGGTITRLDNRNGCFGANSADGTPEILVEHGVTDDENSSSVRLLDLVFFRPFFPFGPSGT